MIHDAIVLRSLVSGYQISDTAEGALNYYGFLAFSGSWYIMKQDNANGTYRYCTGRDDYATSWTNRANLTYEYFNEAFAS